MQTYVVTPVQVLFFTFLLGILLSGLLFYFYIEHVRSKSRTLSPYTDTPMFSADLLPFESKKKIVLFLKKNGRFHNRPFFFSRSLVCRETARVFPNCVDWLGIVRLNWRFINKRYPGLYVSWGSLSPEQKEYVASKHASLEGFQTEYSSTRPLPKDIEKEIAYRKPGPLYVDIDTGVLVGWQIVPQTDLEVLIVQTPEEKKQIRDTIQKSRKKLLKK